MFCNLCSKCVDHYIVCNSICGLMWCTYECAKKEGYSTHKFLMDEENNSCRYCKKEYVSDSNLLEYALSLINMHKEQLTKQYFLINKLFEKE